MKRTQGPPLEHSIATRSRAVGPHFNPSPEFAATITLPRRCCLENSQAPDLSLGRTLAEYSPPHCENRTHYTITTLLHAGIRQFWRMLTAATLAPWPKEIQKIMRAHLHTGLHCERV